MTLADILKNIPTISDSDLDSDLNKQISNNKIISIKYKKFNPTRSQIKKAINSFLRKDNNIVYINNNWR